MKRRISSAKSQLALPNSCFPNNAMLGPDGPRRISLLCSIKFLKDLLSVAGKPLAILLIHILDDVISICPQRAIRYSGRSSGSYQVLSRTLSCSASARFGLFKITS